jgi:D-alanine-D-alanine ligase
MGGPSSERAISMQSGAAVSRALQSRGHRVTDVVVDAEGRLEWPANADVAFIAMHGRFGEDGGIQSWLEARGIAHTGSGALASARAFDKSIAKVLIAKAGLPTAPYEFLSRGQSRTRPLPVVVKPVRQGSSVGVSRVFREEDWGPAVEVGWGYDDVLLVEEYIPGRELTVGRVGDELLPIVEIVPKHGMFDFHAKYSPDGAQHFIPAPIPEETARRCREATLACFDVLGCTGMGRVDIRLRDDGRIFVLELNNIPGFTEISLLPDAARVHGWDFPELCERVLNLARVF